MIFKMNKNFYIFWFQTVLFGKKIPYLKCKTNELILNFVKGPAGPLYMADTAVVYNKLTDTQAWYCRYPISMGF